MTIKTNLIARRDGSDLILFDRGCRFGRLANCEAVYIFECLYGEEAFERAVNDRLASGMSLREMLAVVRECYEGFVAAEEAIANMERAAERSWLNHAGRYDPEAQADLALFDAQFPNGYGA